MSIPVAMSERRCFGAIQYEKGLVMPMMVRARCFYLLVMLLGFSLLVGCSDKEANTFTLVGELPPGFAYSAGVWYVPDPERKCEVTDWRRTMPSLNRKWRQDYNPVAVIEIRKIIKGCHMILSRIKMEIHAAYGDKFHQVSYDNASIGVLLDVPEEARRVMTSEREDTFYGECQWLFRTAGKTRVIWKLLDCKKDNERGEKGRGKPFALYALDQLPGLTVRMNVRLAEKERPSMGDTWVEFANGWKRCLGEGMDDVRGFCRGNYSDFSEFIMPDMRRCTIYPGCEE